MSHISLFEFTQVVKKTLEKNLDPTYWVVAEIGELRIHPKGHCYLELIEKQGEKIVARMKATIWSYTFQNLNVWFEKITGTSLKSGMKILVNGEIQFHESYGLSLNIRDIDANYTLGEREKIKREVIMRLEKEGLIRMNKSLELPLVPQRIAVISSAHSAGYEDFSNQLANSAYQFHISLFAAEMQGKDGTKSVVEALKNIFKEIDLFDLVVILRGGGAQSDLDCFDTYLMGKAIARFPIPVVTGIGHERDETVADLVARTRLKTPTAVAEFLLNGMRSYEESLLRSYERMIGHTQHRLLNESNRINHAATGIKSLSHQLIRDVDSLLRIQQQHIFDTIQHLQKQNDTQIDHLTGRLSLGLKSNLVRSQQQIYGYEQFFHFSDPEYTLQRGFTYTTIDGKSLNKQEAPTIGQVLETMTLDSTIKSKIEEVK